MNESYSKVIDVPDVKANVFKGTFSLLGYIDQNEL